MDAAGEWVTALQEKHHAAFALDFAFIFDGGPKLILFVINGVLCDGGDERQFGWGRYNPALRTINGASEAAVAACVSEVAIHTRALLVNECASKNSAAV